MSKLKELYQDMVECANNCAESGLSKNDIVLALDREFGSYSTLWGEMIADQSLNDIMAFHNDMMNMANSYEAYYE